MLLFLLIMKRDPDSQICYIISLEILCHLLPDITKEAYANHFC